MQNKKQIVAAAAIVAVAACAFATLALARKAAAQE
jgi:hypothetical protein